MKSHGHTLLELTVCVSLIALLAVMMIPSWQNFYAKQRMNAAIESVEGALQFTRDDAISHQAIRIFYPNEGHSSFVTNAQGDIIHTFAALPREDKLIWNSSLGQDAQLHFNALGLTDGQHGTFYYCPHSLKQSSWTHAIVISPAGHITLRDMTTGDFQKYCPHNKL